MVRQFILLLLVCCITNVSKAQIKKFDKKFGYFEYELIPMQQIVDSQSNHIVAGLFRGAHKIGNTTIQSRGDVDVFMIKYDASNNITWVKTFGSSAGENLTNLSCDKDGNIFFTGSFNGSAFYASASDSLNYLSTYSQSRYVIKLDPSGNSKWAKRFSATTNTGDAKSEVFADHLGRVYLIHTNRANGTLNTWQFQDSIIANPSNDVNINRDIPRWMMMRLDEQTGNIKWLNYIANPQSSPGYIVYLNISRPVVDSRNYINFAVTYYGTNSVPIYILGQNVAVNPRTNNVLIKIDSLGIVNRIRDMGAGNVFISEATDLAITSKDELVLINKRANGSENGITYNYLTNTDGINYARIYDSTFSLQKITQLGNQSIFSYAFDKQDRLITLGATSGANFNTTPVNETVKVDSNQSVTFNTQSQIHLYYIRYNKEFKADTLFLENTTKTLVPIGGNSNALRISRYGNIIPNIVLGQMNKVVYRYDSTFKPVNINYGSQRDKEDPIINLVEDDNANIFTIGMIHGKTLFTRKTGIDSLLVPYEKGRDAFVSKYDSLGNVSWIKAFSSISDDNINLLRKTKSGLIFTVASLGSESVTYDNTVNIAGRLNLVKIDFDGNILWKKTIVNQVTGQPPAINLLKSLKNGKILLGVYSNDNFNYANQTINKLGNSNSQTMLVLDESTGDIIRYNRFALRNEALSYLGGVLQKAYEDDNGNLYFGSVSYISNLGTGFTTNELYSLKTNTVTFTNTWGNQSSLLKLDSNLEIKIFKQFLAYSYLSDISGQGNKIYLTGKGRNSQFNFGDTTIALHSYAVQKHFVNYFAVLDTNFRFNKIMKYDTSVVENQFNSFSRKILINPNTKDVYQTLQFVGNTKIDSSADEINSLGGNDMLFLKYDSLGNLLGGQKLGTPQNDFFLDAIINKKGNLVFASQAVDPNYTSTIIYKNTGNTSSSSIAAPNNSINLSTQKYTSFAVNTGNTSSKSIAAPNNSKNLSAQEYTSFAVNTEEVIDKNVLTPDNYLSQYSSLREIGYKPDTALNVSKSIFCIGDSAILTVNEVTDIKWKKNYSILPGETSAVFKPKTTGKYKAILTTVENRIDSTREVEIIADNIPTPAISNVNYCTGVSANALSATVTTGNALKWYGNNLTGGTGNATAPTPVTNTVGTADYYVTQVSNTTGCESGRSKLIVTINPIPSTPAISNVNYCTGVSANALSATVTTGNALKWYGNNLTGGTGNATAPTPVTNTVGTADYYVTQVSNSTGCESGRSKLIVTINPVPSAPAIGNINYCIGVSANALSATVTTGNALKWYGNNLTGGTGNTTAPTPITNTVGTADYYVTQVSNTTGCESERSKLMVTINPIPTIPSISRDVNNNLVSSAPYGNQWYLDGDLQSDTTVKLKPSIAGNYSIKTTQSGCTSALSTSYFYISTSLSQLENNEFIKMAPNPFVNQVNLDFKINGYAKLNVEVISITTGNILFSLKGLSTGMPIFLGKLSSGVYLVKLTSSDYKFVHQFKMVKM